MDFCSRAELFILRLNVWRGLCKGSAGWQRNLKKKKKGFNARHAAGRRRIRCFHWSRLKVQQNPRDTFSNVWEYLHCLNRETFFNGLPRQRCTNNGVKASRSHVGTNIREVFMFLAINNTLSGLQTWTAAPRCCFTTPNFSFNIRMCHLNDFLWQNIYHQGKSN